MTISKDLFLSILAMDAYNRGYDAGLANLGQKDSKVGAATIENDSSILIAANGETVHESAGFYALSYNIGADGPEGLAGKTVISYRGTDSSLDKSTGWIVGAGNIDDWTQAPLALEFYNAATGQSYRDGQANDVILRGHSLGGGLAA
jgi:hypothetical protein